MPTRYIDRYKIPALLLGLVVVVENSLLLYFYSSRRAPAPKELKMSDAESNQFLNDLQEMRQYNASMHKIWEILEQHHNALQFPR